MLVKKDAIVSHLQRISTEGQIPEVIVDGAFSVAAISPTQELIVIAPGMPEVEPLSAEPIGLVDLALFIKALKSLSGESEDLTITFEQNRIKTSVRHGGRLSFVTAAPKMIQTGIDASALQQMKDFLAKGVPIPLTQTTVQGVQETTKLLKAEDIALHVKAEGGYFFIGSEVSHNARFEVESLKPQDGESDYVLHFSAGILVAVLQQIVNFQQAKMLLTGPDSLLAITDGDYTYALSPRAV